MPGGQRSLFPAARVPETRPEPDAPPSPLMVVQGTVERVVHADADSGFTVARLEVEGGRPITIVGTIAGARPGEVLRCEGRWTRDRRYGEQFRVESCLSVVPSTLTGIERYLASGVVKGVGPTLAARLVARFGLATLDVVERESERLAEVEGLGPKRIAEIRRAWSVGREARQVMVFLQGHGVSPAYAGRIVKRYGQGALEVVRANPYRLAEEVAGIGFLTADRIARALGVPPDSPMRLRASLLHWLSETAQDGHTWCPVAALVDGAATRLGVDPAALEEPLARLVAEGAMSREEIAPGEPAVAVAALDAAERRAAEGLARLLRTPGRPLPGAEAAVPRAERAMNLTLAPAQRDAVAVALTAKVVVVTGGPGTGKTTLLRALLAIALGYGLRVELAAPTGRAAQRMAEATASPARTLHRLLDYAPAEGAFRRDRRRPLELDLAVIDEASMLDQTLLTALVDALPPDARLVLVGDVDQLPSVGPGRVLSDLMASGVVPVVRLEQVYRQEAGSLITANAHRIRRGEPPRLPERGAESDFFLIARPGPEEVAATIVHLVAERIPSRFGLDPRSDIQVLAPMHRGRAGAAALNQALQAALNPPGPDRAEVSRGSRVFRAGDRVLQTRNDYDREVWNGDLGRVQAVDLDAGEVRVSFDGRDATYELSDLDALQPAYAVSVHKSQGSEYPAVVVPLVTEHAVMLRRNLLYTAVTRARRLVVLVGSRRALRLALRPGDDAERLTRLRDRLARAAGVSPP